MPESRADAEKRALSIGFNKGDVYCLDGDDKCYIVPHGIASAAGRKTYAEERAKGKSKEYAAKVAHTVDKEARK